MLRLRLAPFGIRVMPSIVHRYHILMHRPTRTSRRLLLGLIVVSAALAYSAIPTLAQQTGTGTGTVTGTVHDAGTHAPLVGAAAMLRDATDSTAKPLGAVTNASGVFSIRNVPLETRYTLEVRSVGYEKVLRQDVKLTAANATMDAGEILLRPQVLETPGVEVTAPRELVSVRADKTVYAVEGNPTYTATNVSELLGQIPSVSVDQDGKVSLRGDDNVTIMMNDRPLAMPREQRDKFLQSLPASMVKDIEIRTNPGAGFEAKNQGGIINIVTQRTMSDVLGGNVNLGGDTRKGYSGGAGLYYNGNDLNASLSGGGYRGLGDGSYTALRLNYLDTNERRNEGSSTSESISGSWYGYGQADYTITKNDLASISFNTNNWSSDYSSYGAHTIYNAAGGISARFYDTSSPSSGVGNSGGYSSASFLFRHTFAEDHKLSLDVSYNGFNYKGNTIYSTSYFGANNEFDSARSAVRINENSNANATIIARLDYENPLSSALKLTLGARAERGTVEDNTDVGTRDRATGAFVLDTVQSNHYRPTNSVNAAYGELAWTIGGGLGLQAGLRAEQANVAAKYESGREIISRDYTNLFPSGSVSYTLAEQHTITASFRRSIALPDIGALNPIVVKWSDLYFSSGNPDLSPEFTQTWELNYSTFWGMGNMITFAPYYSTTDGNIENSQTLVNGATYSRSENFNGTYSLGTSASLGMRPATWLNFRLSGDLFNKVNRGSAISGDIHSSSVGYNANAFVNADLTDGLTLGTSLFINSPGTVGGNEANRFVSWNFSLRQKLLENKLSVSLRVNDPFALQGWRTRYSTPDFYTESSGHWSTRFVSLNISYNFGTIPRMEQHSREKTETKGSSGAGGGAGGGGGGQ